MSPRIHQSATSVNTCQTFNKGSIRLSLVNVLLLINPLDPDIRMSTLHCKPLLLQRLLSRATHSQQTSPCGWVPDSALNGHIRLVRDIRDEDEREDDEGGLDALAQERLFRKLGLAHGFEPSGGAD
jgi:hypothetical protein